MNFKICIFGAGAWGTAMAIHLAHCGQNVFLIPRRQEQVDSLSTLRKNEDYLPDIPFPTNLHIAKLSKEVLQDTSIFIFACPSKALRETANQIKSLLKELNSSAQLNTITLSLCKGLESKTFASPCQILKEIFPDFSTGTISGPTNAKEVAVGFPVAAVFATDAIIDFSKKIQEAFSNNSMRLYLSNDIIGVELGGSLKNIYAIAAGVCDGMELGSNTKASLLTRSLFEMSRIITFAGGNKETAMGLSGTGDLIATAHADWSRNRQFGITIGKDGILTALDKMSTSKSIVEGYYAAKNFFEYTQKNNISAPILSSVYSMIYNNQTPKEVICELMTRSLKQE